MRYISHEMRTPLNVACLGLKVLHDELKRLGLLSLLETAIDTQKACQTSIDILNDLLLYDKIASGLMTLEKRLLDPLDFTAKVLRPFNLQVVRVSFPSLSLNEKTNQCPSLTSPGQGDRHRLAAGVERRVDVSHLYCSSARRPVQDRTGHPQLGVQCSEVHQSERIRAAVPGSG